jgi:hypothetical protein
MKSSKPYVIRNFDFEMYEVVHPENLTLVAASLRE